VIVGARAADPRTLPARKTTIIDAPSVDESGRGTLLFITVDGAWDVNFVDG
jgi:hypothetical protein